MIEAYKYYVLSLAISDVSIMTRIGVFFFFSLIMLCSMQISKRDLTTADLVGDTTVVIEKSFKGIKAIEKAWNNRDGNTPATGSKLFIEAEANFKVCHIHFSINYNYLTLNRK